MQRMKQKRYWFFSTLWEKVLCHCSKLTSVVVSRLWLGMLIQNALGMNWDPLNCYVNCLHMWLLHVISLYLYVPISKYVSILLDFAGHSWMVWQLKNPQCFVLSSVTRILSDVVSYLVSFWFYSYPTRYLYICWKQIYAKTILVSFAQHISLFIKLTISWCWKM